MIVIFSCKAFQQWCEMMIRQVVVQNGLSGCNRCHYMLYVPQMHIHWSALDFLLNFQQTISLVILKHRNEFWSCGLYDLCQSNSWLSEQCSAVFSSSGSELDELSNYELLTLHLEIVCVCVCVLPYFIQTNITLFRHCGYIKFLGHSNGTDHRVFMVDEIH